VFGGLWGGGEAKRPSNAAEIGDTMEGLFSLFLAFVASEPTVQVCRPFGDLATEVSESIGWGYGFRLRVPVSKHNALRLRLDFAHFGQEPQVDYDPELALDFLRHGRRWESGWYQGIGAAWVHRVRSESSVRVTADGVNGSLIAGREQKVGNGQIVLEARVGVASFSGQVDSLVAFAVAYRYHFKDLP
jgi:hypothetical protein